MDSRLYVAMNEYLYRKVGDRAPEGRWVDGMWYPSPSEFRLCCAGHEPTPDDPWRAYNHACTLEHVARYYSVPLEDMEREYEKIKSR